MIYTIVLIILIGIICYSCAKTAGDYDRRFKDK